MPAKRCGTLGFVLLVTLAACSRQTAHQTEPQAPPADIAQAPSAPPAEARAQAAPAPPAVQPIPPATELPIASVDRVALSRPDDKPAALIIHVAGTAASAGWTDPKLTEMPDSDSNTNVLSFQFVATSPQTPDEKRAAQPIEAEIRLDTVPASIKKVRIVSGSNEISAPVVQ